MNSEPEQDSFDEPPQESDTQPITLPMLQDAQAIVETAEMKVLTLAVRAGDYDSYDDYRDACYERGLKTAPLDHWTALRLERLIADMKAMQGEL